MSFKLDGHSFKAPTGFKIERYNITNLERLANGLMSGDLIAKKRKFYFTYEALEADDLQIILDALWNTNKIFYELTYPENGNTKKANVYVGSIPTDLHSEENWVWKDVTFNLIER